MTHEELEALVLELKQRIQIIEKCEVCDGTGQSNFSALQDDILGISCFTCGGTGNRYANVSVKRRTF